jgi:hypothetical protein
MIKELISLLEINHRINISDIGAAWINKTPAYSNLIWESDLTKLFLFDGDERQISTLKKHFGKKAMIFECFLGDGQEHTLYLCHPETGMTSLLKPNKEVLSFFNGFSKFGQVLRTKQIQTKKLDDIDDIDNLHFVKMDVQGSERIVMENGLSKLKQCVAVQLEVSFVPLYEGQTTFGEIDIFMRQLGFIPHSFVNIKRWSIRPTIRDGNFRKPFNQLMEADIIYIRDPFILSKIRPEEIKSLALFSHLFFNSPDLFIYCLERLIAMNLITKGAKEKYMALLQKKPLND